ncbi:sensor histidine kinase [uncultured Tessaracoccus sp.]|uniref:sensor histidine kinase n=1 Tax=uncultured Tessaracoccus sp. TaxID=905023 RepID=UPI0025D79601|nr:sensor histidine kinase [uncultured Tessaracoccus sp.]
MHTRPLPAHWFRTDALVALALAVVGCAMTWLTDVAEASIFDQPLWLQFLGSVLIALPLAWRRRRPLVSAGAQTLCYVLAMVVTGVDVYASQVALFLGFYSIGAWSRLRGAALVERIAICVFMAGWLFAGILFRLDEIFHVQQVSATKLLAFLAINSVINVAYFTGAWIFGDRAWQQALERDELEAANESIRALQAELVASAIEEERLRIARELHDVVAHHVTAMSVQAAAARRLLERDPARAAAPLKHIESSARAAVQDLRTMVLTLRDSDQRTGTGSLPTLADLDELVALVRDGGRDVTLDRIGDTPRVSPAVELTLYRVAQEGLTNAVKHAGPVAHIAVRLRTTPRAVELEVSDDGRASPALLPGSGTGLTGMRERLAAVGGTLKAGPKARGGYLVRATVPTGGTA